MDFRKFYLEKDNEISIFSGKFLYAELLPSIYFSLIFAIGHFAGFNLFKYLFHKIFKLKLIN